VLRAAAAVRLRPRIRGGAALAAAERERLEGGKDSRLMIMANRTSVLDGILLGLWLPVSDLVVAAPADMLARPWARAWLRLAADPVAVDLALTTAAETLTRLLESGRPVLVFPEGRVCPAGMLGKVYEAAGAAALKTGAKIVTVRVEGPRDEGNPRGKRPPRLRLKRVTLTIMPARGLIDSGDRRSAREAGGPGELLRRRMAESMFADRPGSTLYGAFRDGVKEHGRRRVVVDDVMAVKTGRHAPPPLEGAAPPEASVLSTYGDLDRTIQILGRILARKTREGERVGVMLANSTPLTALFFALISLGRIPALINFTAGAEGIRGAFAAAQIRTVVTSRAFIERTELTALLAEVCESAGIAVVYLEDLVKEARPADKAWLVLVARWFPRRVRRDATEADAAVVLFTSGSEGRPKGVELSHRAIMANLMQMRAVLNFNKEDRLLNVLPMFHAFGLSVGTLLPILTGARAVLYPNPLAYRAIPDISYARRCTVLLGTASFLAGYGRQADPYDFHTLRSVVAGGERLEPSVASDWFNKFGIRMLPGYGTTETGPVISTNVPKAFKAGTVGQLFPGMECQLVPVEGVDRGGCLHVKGPNLMNGYLRVERPGVLEPPSSELGAGWHDTGDIVEIDERDFLRIVGRIKRFAKIGGEMVSLETVEKVASAASPGAAHAACAVPDRTKGEVVVLATTDQGLGHQDLLRAAQAMGVPELWVPRRLERLEEIPRLPTGKTDYVKLQKLLTGQLGQPEPARGS
jgi:acyl-[acyl-carrier-protein]-phospholipid O-acyltransferase/long-chain-fatty-acid--[acyl-carrier-protein] ligase